ncbi:MAG: DUF3592 domain-containing protein [Verrucomicrobia bacterium]|nr:DUF3592 domain-containing protein [Verrucomicrobiota bacterium]MCH8513248.1 DUF3592 domain-containing protein [Kiritimatiellia bacterium]
MEHWKDALLKDPQYPFFALIGLVLLCYPLHAKWETAKLKRRRTVRTRGEVVDEETRSASNVGMDLGRHRVPTRHPVVVFEVEGVQHRVVSDTGASWQTLRRGQTVDVHYNPNNPDDAGVEHISLDAVEQLLLWLLPLIGIGMFLWGLVNLSNLTF